MRPLPRVARALTRDRRLMDTVDIHPGHSRKPADAIEKIWDDAALASGEEDTLDDLADGLDVLMILEKAFEKTIRAHVVPSPPSPPSSSSAATSSSSPSSNRAIRSFSRGSSVSARSNMNAHGAAESVAPRNYYLTRQQGPNSADGQHSPGFADMLRRICCRNARPG